MIRKDKLAARVIWLLEKTKTVWLVDYRGKEEDTSVLVVI